MIYQRLTDDGKGFEYCTKLVGVTTGAAGVGKGSVDIVEAIVCRDGIGAAVYAVGIAAASIQICASFIPGPNVTSLVTTPVSVGCKVFVWVCKNSKIPWRTC